MLARYGQKKRPRSGSGFRPTHESGLRTLQVYGLRILVLGIAFIILVAAITQRLTPDTGVVDVDVAAQTIAPDTIQAEFPFNSVDLQQTRKAQDEAVGKVPDTYRIDYARADDCLRVFQEWANAILAQREGLDEAIRDALLAADSSQLTADVVDAAVLAYASRLMKEDEFKDFQNPAILALWLKPSPGSIPQRQFENEPKAEVSKKSAKHVSAAERPEPAYRVEELLEPSGAPIEFAYAEQLRALGEDGLRSALTYGMLADEESKQAIALDPDRKIVILRSHPIEDQKVSEELSFRDAPTPAKARERLASRIREKIQVLAGRDTEAPVDWSRVENATFEIAAKFLGNTLVYDQVATEGAREAARRAVEPVVKPVAKKEIIQEGGRHWTEQSRLDFAKYMEMKAAGIEPAQNVLFSLLSNMIVVGLVLACLVRSLRVVIAKRRDTFRSLLLTLLIMVCTVVVGRVMSYFDPTGFSVPVAAGAILLTILASARVASVTAFLTAVLLSVLFNYSWQLLVLSAAMSSAGLLSIYRVRRRSDMGGASVKATLVGLATILAIALAGASPFSETPLRSLGLVMLNGLVCMFLVPGVLSPLERLFGITTDIQLLEYSDLNNEVLSKLAVEVPATHAHSLRVGELAEAAADAVGANGLLARVCAFYHDIGKLRRPQYFSENQTGANVHDEMSPRLSARAIASHVMEGVEMAREFHLPKPIVDGVLEHHGTCMISFFYQEALAQQKHGDVREEDFRYPGPKPQSRESAILMICDAAESSVRSIKNPNEERVREMVDKIISTRASDRQFDECNLTLRDLDVIANVITRRLWSHQHRRIEYPDQKPGNITPNVIPMAGRPNS